MKVIAMILVWAVIIACSADQRSEIKKASAWHEVHSSGYGSITLAFVPSDGFSYTDLDGNLTGVTIELMRDFTRYVKNTYDVDIEIIYEPFASFSDFYQYVKESETGVFGVANVTITEERRNELTFSPPYMSNIATLITHSDISEISTLEQIPDNFSDLMPLAFQGTLHQDRLERIIRKYLPDAEMELAHSNNEIIERTSAQNRYFSYVDIYNYWRAAERGASLRRHAAGDISSEEFGVIMPLKSDWIHLIKEFFNYNTGYVYSERYRQLMVQHLGEELAELLLDQI